MVFFQLVGTIIQFEMGQVVQTRLGAIGGLGLLLLALAPVLVRLSLKAIRRTLQEHPGWWALGLLVCLLALSLQA
ncbi:hypothetical protein [Streptomyces sp. 142MFCol3.1]|uniref:hypothetical protein n=1 Tax=Streptomyces sp. 142MFCol3.1 TaxID=1172179 RepID=UPI00131A10FB|nr:hypothetical protein [Streptomyces sp. 142MFCol3.1]